MAVANQNQNQEPAEAAAQEQQAAAPAAPKKVTVKSLFENEAMKARVNEILGKNAATFTTSVIQLVNQSKELAECDPVSVVNAAMVAATLDLPLNQNLGFAYVIAYNVKKGNDWAKVAQFQLGYKGFKQLAMRTGQFVVINQSDVRLGELKSRDRLRGTIDFEWIDSEAERLKAPIIGYVSFFQLQNGYASTFYMSVEEIEAHAVKYSKSYAKSKTGLWKDDKKGMSEKTVTKLNLSKNAPLSIDDKASQNLVNALRADQAVIKDFEDPQDGVEFPDNDTQDAEFTFVDPEAEAAAMEAEAMDKINNKKQNGK